MITPQTNLKVTMVIAVSIVVFIVGATASSVKAFGEKADKSETDSIRSRMNTMESEHKLALQEQRQMFEMVKEIRADQKWMVQEMWKMLSHPSNHQPPASTPAPNPLGR